MITDKNQPVISAHNHTETIPALRIQSTSLAGRNRPFNMALGFVREENSYMESIRSKGPEDHLPMAPVYHSHSYFEWIFVLEGVLTQHIESTVFQLNAGDAILLNTQIRHCEDLKTECSCVYLDISADFLRHLLYDNRLEPVFPQNESRLFREFCPQEDREERSNPGMALIFRRTLQSQLFLSHSKLTKAHQLLDAISDRFISREWGYGFAIQGLLLQFLQILEDPAQYHSTLLQADTDTEDMLYAAVLHYLTEQHGRISRGTLAEILHYHPDYLNRVIKRHAGINYHRLCQNLWLSYAKNQLITTEKSVSQIIQELGFENKSHFYSVFRRETNMTPEAFRKEEKPDQPL